MSDCSWCISTNFNKFYLLWIANLIKKKKLSFNLNHHAAAVVSLITSSHWESTKFLLGAFVACESFDVIAQFEMKYSVLLVFNMK